jgi:PD-(D/E)XK nuclease superfamily
VETITSLYNGEVRLGFNSANHRYRVHINDKVFKAPSVTGICGIVNKPALIYWAIDLALGVCRNAILPGVEHPEAYLEGVLSAARREAEDVRRKAAEHGTDVHRRIEAGLRDLREDEGDIVVRNIRDFLGKESIRILHTERRVYSRRYRYSGTLDAIGETPAGLVLIDWKNSKHVYSEYRLQTAAYAYAWQEEFPDRRIQKRCIIRIDEEGNIHPYWYPLETLRGDFLAFLGAKRVYERTKQIEREQRQLERNN